MEVKRTIQIISSITALAFLTLIIIEFILHKELNGMAFLFFATSICSISILSGKTTKESVKLNPKLEKILKSVLIFLLISGIITFLIVKRCCSYKFFGFLYQFLQFYLP